MLDGQEVEIIQPLLGLQPYVVIECVPGDGDKFDLNIRAGGGINSRDALAALLLLAIEELTGVPTDAYSVEVDTARRAAGLAPLNGIIQSGEVTR